MCVPSIKRERGGKGGRESIAGRAIEPACNRYHVVVRFGLALGLGLGLGASVVVRVKGS